MTQPLSEHPNARKLALGLALLWAPVGRTRMVEAMKAMGFHTGSERGFDAAEVKRQLQVLQDRGWLWMGDLSHGRERLFPSKGKLSFDHGLLYCLSDPGRAQMYRELLEEFTPEDLEIKLFRTWGVDPEYWWRLPLHDRASRSGLVRLKLFTGATREDLRELKARLSYYGWENIWREVCLESFDPELFRRVDGQWRSEALTQIMADLLGGFYQDYYQDVYRWILDTTARDPASQPSSVRHHVAAVRILRGDREEAARLLEGLDTGFSDSLHAALRAQEGDWAGARTAFEEALKRMRKELGKRDRFLFPAIGCLYPLSLLALHTVDDLEAARKFCQAESGKRNKDGTHGWLLWVHAIAVRLGTADPETTAFSVGRWRGTAHLENLWRVLLRTWLGRETFPAVQRGQEDPMDELVGSVRAHLKKLEFGWLDDLVATCASVYAGGDPPPGFFVSAAQEKWRLVLDALAALSGSTGKGKGKRAPAAKRMLWAVSVDGSGRILDVSPLEQRRGKRGWNAPRPVPLSRLAKATKLDPVDAAVARSVKAERYYASRFRMDRATAMLALVEHPRVVLAHDTSRLVEVSRGTAGLEVLREGDVFRVVMNPPPHEPEDEEDEWGPARDANVQREAEELRFVHVAVESPTRIRVVHYTEQQRAVAQILASDVTVPAGAEEELQRTLRALSGHFEIQSDHTAPARQQDPETRLRAELASAGHGVLLRLVAAPLGPNGPRLTPGLGRPRLMATVDGEPVATMRDLTAERAGVDRVLDAVGFLEDPFSGDQVIEWLVEDPELALALIAELPSVEAVAGLDWPRGAPVRVVPVHPSAVSVRVTTDRDWFGMEGEVQVAEGLVLSFAALLAAGAGRSRFIPMGDGTYAALSRELHERVRELSALTQTVGDTVQVPHAAVSLVEEFAEDTTMEADNAFRERVDRLRDARGWTPPVPSGLQATLRPYQEDGFVWAMRLARAGFGACLADDMGLGKTIQAMGVLLSRASEGPALVVAPTSVCGNWASEIRRFAPSLDPTIFGGGDREAAIASAGAGSVIIVSYGLMLQEQKLFASRTWSTLVADEAQAVKNAGAKRSRALFALDAGFRLALSGTPIENRLSELWSIMRFCNPGLLASSRRFQEHFAGPIERDGDRDAQRRLRRLVGPFVLRRTKGEVLRDLPERTELVLHVDADVAEVAHYEALRRTAVSEALDVAGASPGQSQFHILALLTKLRRAACDPRLVTPEYPGRGAKVRAFFELAEELVANGHKALVFSQFVDFLTLLREPLDEAGVAYQYLDGSTPAAERTRRVSSFQAGEGDLFLISLKAGGFGLNLTAADYVVITDPWWNPAAEDQAMGRAHRIGQSRPVTAYRLVREGTLEEGILRLHHEKRALAEGILADSGEARAIPDSEELLALMRGEDLEPA